MLFACLPKNSQITFHFKIRPLLEQIVENFRHLATKLVGGSKKSHSLGGYVLHEDTCLVKFVCQTPLS